MLSRRTGRFQSKEETRRSQQVTPLQIASRPVSASTNRIYGPRSTPCHSETQFSEVSPNQANDAYVAVAKPPLNPAFRGVLDDFRPGSADSFRSGNSDRPRVLQRPKREPRKPPVSFRKPSSLLSTQSSLGESHLSQIGQADSDAVSFTEGRERTASMTSLARRLSKDILDAVDEFRPLDFRSRVQAAGARDYGEDVADRNIRLSMSVSSPNLYSHFSSVRSHSSQSVNINSRTKSINSMNEHYDSTPRALSSHAESDRPDFFSKRNKNRLSLNTYKPSGFVSPVPATPRSPVTTPGHRGGLTPSDFDSPDARNDMRFQQQYHISPAVSNFSLPTSPMTVRYPNEAYKPGLVHDNEENSFSEEREFGDIIQSHRSSQRKSGASDVQGFTKAAARFSQGTYRSSLASSVTSRYPSMDFMPLGYPRSQGHPRRDNDEPSHNENVRLWRSQSLHSHRHSRSNSSGNSHKHQRPKSLLTRPSGLTNLVEADGPTDQPHSNGTQDWALVTTSTGSASSSSNGLFSGASGSMRPVSRHTKATSVDSIPRPLSFQSGLSASIGQSAGGWSPSTTRSTVFNIDDYVSSDDDSFTTKKRPTGEGEEELLFKGGYGATGAALPGLLESPMRASPLRVVGFHGAGPLMSPSQLTEEGTEAEDGEGAAEGPDIDDSRRQYNPNSPFTQLRHKQGRAELDNFRTYGKQSARPRAQSNMTPSWLPSDDWVRPGSRHEQTKRPATSHASTTSNTAIYDPDLRPPCRGQTRLSALGTLQGQDFVDPADSFRVERPKSRELGTSAIREEIDPTVALRLRKEAKARKREDEARTIRERRMTRAFGRLDEEKLAALQQAQGEEVEEEEAEMENRGRTRVRVMKGKSVISS
ncbi:hypothetical protein N0V93_004182 [Gnomoniopsis smithogilvyi]|uniref:Uncharacterized protein n=1 Tax=Gnomoniopsis smithogilvyi TaxID=1191159 RepID=A0A9W8YS47_9PEZI|nr:hypothetical protein N0V93_004182 [Gnomoniopsis smithogilvyi]